MGLDAYIEPSYERSHNDLYPAFKRAVDARDATDRDDPAHDKLQEEVENVARLMWDENENYFRDSYNNSNVMRVLDVHFGKYLSQRPSAKYPEETSDVLEGDGLAAFIRDVEASIVPKDIEERGYFVQKRERLLRFLKRGQANGLYIRMSY